MWRIRLPIWAVVPGWLIVVKISISAWRSCARRVMLGRQATRCQDLHLRSITHVRVCIIIALSGVTIVIANEAEVPFLAVNVRIHVIMLFEGVSS